MSLWRIVSRLEKKIKNLVIFDLSKWIMSLWRILSELKIFKNSSDSVQAGNLIYVLLGVNPSKAFWSRISNQNFLIPFLRWDIHVLNQLNFAIGQKKWNHETMKERQILISYSWSACFGRIYSKFRLSLYRIWWLIRPFTMRTIIFSNPSADCDQKIAFWKNNQPHFFGQ